MKGALIILLALVVTGVILYIHHRLTDKNDPTEESKPDNNAADRPEGCCGQHLVCEKESLLAGVSKDIEYYEDEELDAYRGMKPDEYTDEQIDQFRDVLYTLRPEEIGGWARSIQLRKIEGNHKPKTVNRCLTYSTTLFSRTPCSASCS